MHYSIDTLNKVDKTEFIELLSAIYEETPAVAVRVWPSRPFQSLSDLHQKMANIVNQMTLAEQLTLIRAHPELGANVEMADASVREQAGAGLDQISEAEYAQLKALNEAYRRKFEFPFVMAVRGYGKAEIVAAIEARLDNAVAEERARSLQEINQIAKLRLETLISD